MYIILIDVTAAAIVTYYVQYNSKPYKHYLSHAELMYINTRRFEFFNLVYYWYKTNAVLKKY